MEKSAQKQSTEALDAINEIIDGINSGEAMVFCGAGISRNSGLPVVDQIVPYILDKLDIPKDEAELIITRTPFEAFIEALKGHCKLDKLFDIYNLGEPNTNHLLLAKLIKTGKVKTIVTTNFDKLIERALQEHEAMQEGRDYFVIYKEPEFENINWMEDKIRIIKIHGSVDSRETMAINLKQVAGKTLSKARMTIIEQMFLKGRHDYVIVLGYSSSDLFDLSIQIQAIAESCKKVYYVQHLDVRKEEIRVEDISEKAEKNPFKKYKNSYRLHYDTDEFVKKIWTSLVSSQPYEFRSGKTNWRDNVDEWYKQATKDLTEEIKYAIPGSICIKIGMYKTAQKNYEQAMRIAREINDKAGIAKCLANLASTYISLGEYKKAIDYYVQALEIAGKMEDKYYEGSCFMGLGMAYSHISEYRKAIFYFEVVLRIAREMNDEELESTSIGNLGNNFCHLRKFREAIECFKQALKIAEDIGDKNGEGTWLNNMGNAYQHLAEYDKSINNHEQALRIAKEMGDKGGEATAIANLGIDFFCLKEHGRAISYFAQALKIAKDIDDKEGEARCLYNLGNTYNDLGESAKAIEYSELALKIARGIGDKKGEGLCLRGLGNAHSDLGDYVTAITSYRQALEIFKEIYDDWAEESLLGNLGFVYMSLGEHKMSIECFEQSMKIAEKNSDNDGIWKALASLGDSYFYLEDYNKSIECYEQAIKILTLMFGPDHPNAKIIEGYLRVSRSKLG